MAKPLASMEHARTGSSRRRRYLSMHQRFRFSQGRLTEQVSETEIDLSVLGLRVVPHDPSGSERDSATVCFTPDGSPADDHSETLLREWMEDYLSVLRCRLPRPIPTDRSDPGYWDAQPGMPPRELPPLGVTGLRSGELERLCDQQSQLPPVDRKPRQRRNLTASGAKSRATLTMLITTRQTPATRRRIAGCLISTPPALVRAQQRAPRPPRQARRFRR